MQPDRKCVKSEKRCASSQNVALLRSGDKPRAHFCDDFIVIGSQMIIDGATCRSQICDRAHLSQKFDSPIAKVRRHLRSFATATANRRKFRARRKYATTCDSHNRRSQIYDEFAHFCDLEYNSSVRKLGPLKKNGNWVHTGI